MEAMFVLIALALALTVVLKVIDDSIPFHPPVALAPVVALVIAIGLSWALDYSVFAAFGQELRAEWMHPVASGLALVAVGEFLRSVVSAVGQRATAPTGTPAGARQD